MSAISRKWLYVERAVGLWSVSGFMNLWRTYAALKLEPEVVGIGPVKVQIEPTTRCNLDCTMCNRKLRNRCKDNLSLEQFKYLLSEFPNLQNLVLTGLGEPLLNRDFIEMVIYAKSRGIRVQAASNGLLLSRDDNMTRLLNSGIDLIYFSLDGGTKETFERIRAGASFELFLDNVAQFVSMRNEVKAKPTIILNVVEIPEIICELDKIVSLGKQMGVDGIKVQPLHTWSKRKLPEMHEETQVVAKKIAQQNNVSLSWLPRSSTDPTGRVCKWPWYATYVTVDGFVTPCCMHGSNPNVLNFGNIFEENFTSIWNSERYRRFRKDLSTRDSIPQFCENCPGY